jgi:hypothetical protein
MCLYIAACGSTGDITRSLGLVRDPPDEFQVTTRAPLAIPPNFTLHPPAPGASRPQELPLSTQAEAALVPEAALAGSTDANSPGQAALLKAAGPKVPDDIRRQVDEEALSARSGSMASKLLFWQGKQPPGVTIDPLAESRRLQQPGVAVPSPSMAPQGSS